MRWVSRDIPTLKQNKKERKGKIKAKKKKGEKKKNPEGNKLEKSNAIIMISKLCGIVSLFP